MFKFSDVVEIQGQSESVTEKIISDGKEMTGNWNNRSETEFNSVEDPLNMHRTVLNQTILVSEIPNIIKASKKSVSIFNDEFCEEQAFPYLLATVKVKVTNMFLEIF